MMHASARMTDAVRVGIGLFLGFLLMGPLEAHEVVSADAGDGNITEGHDPMPAPDEYDTEQSDSGSGAVGSTSGGGPMFDTDRGVTLIDSDGDSFPDLTESIELTNPYDAASYPGSDLPEEIDEASDFADPGFPASSCRSGYRQAGSRLCISTNVHNAASYANALVYCRDRRGRVASYGDLRYLYVRTSLDAAYNPSGRWIGNFVDDDRALCGNRSITTNNDPDIGNFEGECSRFDSRNYWCAHDRQ